MSDENNKKSKFNIASVLTMMTVLTPAVYLLGYFYEMGVLSAYGISNEYFPRSVQNYFNELPRSKLRGILSAT